MKTTPPEPANQAPDSTLDDFRAAVRYLLINDHGMPDLVADAAIAVDDDYVQRAYANRSGDRRLVMEVAGELAIKPRDHASWVRVGEGQIVVSLNDNVQAYLKSLVEVGLYGQTPEDVAHTMLCRGIEGLLSVAKAASPTRR